MTAVERRVGDARHRIGFFDQATQDTGAALCRFVEQDRPMLALPDAPGAELRLLELEHLLASALQGVLQARL